MDPLSIAAGVASLLASITTLSIRLNDIRRGFSEARNEIDQLNRELTDLSTILTRLHEVGETLASPTLAEDLTRILQQCENTGQDSAKLLQTASKKTFRGIYWVVSGKAECLELCRSLEAQKATINVTLSLLSILNDQRMQSGIDHVISEIHRLRRGAGGDYMLQRYLEEAETYAGSIYEASTVVDDAEEGPYRPTQHDALSEIESPRFAIVVPPRNITRKIRGNQVQESAGSKRGESHKGSSLAAAQEKDSRARAQRRSREGPEKGNNPKGQQSFKRISQDSGSTIAHWNATYKEASPEGSTHNEHPRDKSSGDERFPRVSTNSSQGSPMDFLARWSSKDHPIRWDIPYLGYHTLNISPNGQYIVGTAKNGIGELLIITDLISNTRKEIDLWACKNDSGEDFSILGIGMSYNNVAAVVRYRSQGQKCLITLPLHDSISNSVENAHTIHLELGGWGAFSSDGQLFAHGNGVITTFKPYDLVLEVYDVASGDKLFRKDVQLPESHNPYNITMLFNGENTKLLTCIDDESLFVVDARTGEPLMDYRDSVPDRYRERLLDSFSVSPDFTQLATSFGRQVVIYNLKSTHNDSLFSFEMDTSWCTPRFLPGSKYLLIFSAQWERLYVLDTESGQDYKISEWGWSYSDPGTFIISHDGRTALWSHEGETWIWKIPELDDLPRT